MTSIIRRRSRSLMLMLCALVFLVTASVVAFVERTADIIYRPDYEDLFLKAVADEHLFVSRMSSAVSKLERNQFAGVCREKPRKSSPEPSQLLPLELVPYLFSTFTEFQWAPKTHEVCVVRYSRFKSGEKFPQNSQVRKFRQADLLAVYGQLPKQEVATIHGALIDLRSVKLERLHVRSASDPDIRAFYQKGKYIRVRIARANQDESFLDRLLVSKLRFWLLRGRVFRVQLVAGTLGFLGLVCALLGCCVAQSAYEGFFVQIAQNREGDLARFPELVRRVPSVFRLLFCRDVAVLAAQARTNLLKNIKEKKDKIEQALLANRPLRSEPEAAVKPKELSVEEQVVFMAEEVKALLDTLSDVAGLQEQLVGILSEQDLTSRLRLLKGLRKRVRQAAHDARVREGLVNAGAPEQSAISGGMTDDANGETEYVTLVSRIEAVCPSEEIARFSPSSLDPQAVRSILFALLKPASRDRTFGERYRQGRALQRMAGNLYVRLAGESLPPKHYEEALNWLVQQGVVRAYKLSSTFSLEPKPMGGKSVDAQALIRMMHFCDKRFKAG